MGRRKLYASATERQRAHRQRQRAAGLRVPCVQIGELVTLYCGDAHAIAPTLQPIDALITDPPYGTAFDFTKPRRSRTPLPGCSTAPRWAANVHGDAQPFDPSPWLGYPQIILWGANHYASRLPDSPAWLTWDKRDGSTPDHHADCEHAWTSVPGVSRLYRHLWRGMLRAGAENIVHGGKLHPAQKPVALIAWCVQKTTGGVLDPFMGSGTTGLACLRLGRPFVGIEIDQHYFAVACQRIAAAWRQLPLFPATQEEVEPDSDDISAS